MRQFKRWFMWNQKPQAKLRTWCSGNALAQKQRASVVFNQSFFSARQKIFARLLLVCCLFFIGTWPQQGFCLTLRHLLKSVKKSFQFIQALCKQLSFIILLLAEFFLATFLFCILFFFALAKKECNQSRLGIKFLFFF